MPFHVQSLPLVLHAFILTDFFSLKAFMGPLFLPVFCVLYKHIFICYHLYMLRFSFHLLYGFGRLHVYSRSSIVLFSYFRLSEPAVPPVHHQVPTFTRKIHPILMTEGLSRWIRIFLSVHSFPSISIPFHFHSIHSFLPSSPSIPSSFLTSSFLFLLESNGLVSFHIWALVALSSVHAGPMSVRTTTFYNVSPIMASVSLLHKLKDHRYLCDNSEGLRCWYLQTY